MSRFHSLLARALALVGAFAGTAAAASAQPFGPPLVVGRAPFTSGYGCAPAPLVVAAPPICAPPLIALPPLLRPGPVIVRPAPIHRHWRHRRAYYGPDRVFVPAPRVFVR